MDRSFGALSSGRWKWLGPFKYVDGMSITRSNAKSMAFSKLVRPSWVQKTYYRKDAINGLSDRISSGRCCQLIKKFTNVKYMRGSFITVPAWLLSAPSVMICGRSDRISHERNMDVRDRSCMKLECTLSRDLWRIGHNIVDINGTP